MNTNTTARILVGAAALMTAGLGTAHAYEFGYAGAATKPGITIGPGAGAPPPGLYMFDQVFTYQSTLHGPGAGNNPAVNGYAEATGLLFVPGWTFLGATYDAVIVQPFVGAAVGELNNPPGGAAPGFQQAGVHNTFIVPVELTWKLGNSGFSVLAGLGIYVPDGSISGASGLNSIGNPWWTFQPNLKISYLANGWNLTANLYDEINTKNTITDYTSGQIFHADFTVTKTIGKWTVGPVAYYAGQITNDTSSAFYGGAINTNRYDVWAVGGLVGYDFGPVSLNVWVLDEVSANASGGTAGAPGVDTATVTKGWTAFASISYRLWGPEAPAEHGKAPMIVK